MSAAQFRAKVGEWAQTQPQKIDGFARQVCYEMAERVVMKTPVDTGFLRGSWQPAIDKVRNDAGAADTTGGKALGEASLVIAGIKVGARFYMTNNAAYARFVEYGTSKMVGRFFVTDTVKQWQSVVDKVAGELGLKS